MNSRTVLSIAGSLGILVASLITAGCDDPNTSELDSYFESHPFVSDPRSTSARIVSINPSAATISSVGGRIVFRAAGGTGGYTWDVSNTSMGTITPSGDAQGVYVSKAIGDNEVVVYDRAGNAAIAYISGSEQASMKVTAKPEELPADNDMTVLTVSGGSAPYTWTVADPGRGGYPSGNTGASVVYRRYSAGDNAVTVTDGAGNSSSLIISQP